MGSLCFAIIKFSTNFLIKKTSVRTNENLVFLTFLRILYITALSFIILFCIPFLPIVALIHWETIEFKVSIGIYFLLIFFISSVISALMLILSIVMFRILTKIETNNFDKAKYLLKLKFTRLSFIMIFCLIFASISLLLFYLYWNGIVLNWTLHFLIPMLLYICPAIFIFVLFVGITNWTLFKEFFLFSVSLGKYEVEEEILE